MSKAVSQFTLWPGDERLAVLPIASVELPSELRAAPPERQWQFRAGRFCAMKAMAGLGYAIAGVALPRTASGVPRWPRGLTGSITHTGTFVSAAVARTSDVAGIGIDTEPIMTAARARQVSPAVAWASELACARALGYTRLEALTLVFSAKESIFKCLFPAVGRVFDFYDVRIVSVDALRGTFAARVVRTLAERFPAGRMLHGRFAIDGAWVHTALELPAAE